MTTFESEVSPEIQSTPTPTLSTPTLPKEGTIESLKVIPFRPSPKVSPTSPVSQNIAPTLKPVPSLKGSKSGGGNISYINLPPNVIKSQPKIGSMPSMTSDNATRLESVSSINPLFAENIAMNAVTYGVIV
jgi:hypothetical protein